ncbi:hypothetical protein [Magnetovibrio blakemorei]|uniref:Uncharacterized protein n=1 Tax=Magnetovibrio blakemorei TaxID=28181 RepID=A0A1E5Q5C3_9PROT|nr:hypothetical protein [Magnetovibrio blakemorei]OEJ65376.1 hypothetical protein BEN30_14765 [Magnetovibrio blakemorei]
MTESITPMQITTGIQQVLMRLIGVMIEKGTLSEDEARRVFVEASMTLRQHAQPDTDGAALFVDLLGKQLPK